MVSGECVEKQMLTWHVKKALTSANASSIHLGVFASVFRAVCVQSDPSGHKLKAKVNSLIVCNNFISGVY